MKYLIALFTFCFFSFNLCAQISTLDNNITLKTPKKIDPSFVPYDSLSPIHIQLYISGNFSKEKYYQNKKYIGQKIFLPAKNTNLILSKKRTKYRGNETKYFGKVAPYYGARSEDIEVWTNVYKPIEGDIDDGGIRHISSDSAYNKYYTITDVILDYYDFNDKNSDDSEFNEFHSTKQKEIIKRIFLNNCPKNVLYNQVQERDRTISNYSGNHCQNLLLELRNDISGDTVYTYPEEDFISTGFFYKAKKLYEGKNFIWYDATVNPLDTRLTLTDFVTNNNFRCDEIGTIFKCSAINVYKNRVVAILENKKGQFTQEISEIKLHTNKDVPNTFRCLFPDYYQNEVDVYWLNPLACGLDKGLMLEEDLNILNKKLVEHNKKEQIKKQINTNQHNKKK